MASRRCKRLSSAQVAELIMADHDEDGSDTESLWDLSSDEDEGSDYC